MAIYGSVRLDAAGPRPGSVIVFVSPELPSLALLVLPVAVCCYYSCTCRQLITCCQEVIEYFPLIPENSDE